MLVMQHESIEHTAILFYTEATVTQEDFTLLLATIYCTIHQSMKRLVNSLTDVTMRKDENTITPTQ
jgi:hypothetical protein